MFLHVVSIISGKIVPFSPPKQPLQTCSHSTRWPVGSLSRRLQDFLVGKFGEMGGGGLSLR